MTALAIRSLRHRATAFAATFVAVLLGTILTGSFATLAETGTGPVSDADASTLTILGAVVGGWGAVIVLFSVASTVSITVRQRALEIGLLRTVGATPRQARRLIRTEVLAVTLAAAVSGAAVATLTGRALLSAVRADGLVADGVEYGGSPVSPALTAAAVVLVSLLAAAISGRRATRGPALLVLADAGAEVGRLRWWRWLAAALLAGYGLATAAVTITVTAHSANPYDAMETSGASGILVGVGLAVVAPVLLRWGARLLRPLLGGGAAAYLAAWNTTRRSHLLAGVLAPVIVLTSAATGTLMLIGIDGRTLKASAEVSAQDADAITLLNNVVVGMISLFAAIMVVNAFAAVVADRRQELERLRLLGATPHQVRGTVVAEAGVVAVVGVVLGTLAALTTVVPFAVARHEGFVPDGELWLPVAVALGTVVLTVVSARAAIHRLHLPGAVR